jgi:hypothetical protein
MKAIKTIMLLIILTFSVQISAQKPEKQAKNFTDNITEILSLSKQESEGVYKIQLSRINESIVIKKEYEDDEDTRKEKLKELGNKTFGEMRTLLGKEKMKIWNEHKSKKNK